MTYSPFNKKLGVKIRAEGKEWMIEDLYRKDQKVVYKSGNELPTQGGEVKESVKSIYENAEWKLKPSKDVYHIWIDQYIENTEAIIAVSYTHLISIFFSNSIAIIFGEIFAISPLVVDNISQKTPIVQFFSPASWIGISNIGYEYNWDCPTMGYIIFVLCVLIGVLSVMSLLKIKKKGIY